MTCGMNPAASDSSEGRMRRHHIVAAFAATAAVAAAMALGLQIREAPDRAEAQSPAAIDIRGFAFAPQTTTVAVGATVTWTNRDQAPHTATADNGAFDSGPLEEGQSYAFRPTRTGRFNYMCTIHPEMRGVLTVTSGTSSA